MNSLKLTRPSKVETLISQKTSLLLRVFAGKKPRGSDDNRFDTYDD